MEDDDNVPYGDVSLQADIGDGGAANTVTDDDEVDAQSDDYRWI